MNTHDANSTDVEGLDEDTHDTQLSLHLRHLHEHTIKCQQHITGRAQYQSLAPSFHPPNSYWTSEEKGRFFHALGVHSRLRPDLIAEHVATKSLVDVQLYMSILEQELDHFEGTSSDTGLKSISLSRKDFDSAYEVTDDWTEFENDLADAASCLEPALLQASVPRARELEKHTQKLTLRAKKGSATVPGQLRDREGEKARHAQYQDWLKHRESEWEVEDALSHLDDVRLRAIDSLLRDDEDGWSVPRESTLGSKCGDSFRAKAQEDGEEPPERGVTHRGTEDTEETPTMGAQLTEAAVNGLPSEDLALSPASRKRLRKRLYMRRKRAEKTGQVVDKSLNRLKPGRKAKPRQRNTQDSGSDDDSVDEDRPTRHSHPSGRTLPYRVLEELQSLGIDAVRLRQDGLGLFHMTTIGRLMRTYNALHEVSEDVVSRISSSTIRALHDHLVSFVSQLVRQSIVSRDQELLAKTQTKVWRVANSQVITAANVAHALSILSERQLDSRQHFASLLERLNLHAESESSSDENQQPDEGDEDSGNSESQARAVEVEPTSSSDALPSVEPSSLNRIIFPPFIRLPASYSITSPPSTPLYSYLPWPSSSNGNNLDEDSEDLLEPETDEEALEAELADEEELDDQDHAQEEAYESRLWRMFDPSPEDAQLVVTGRKRGRAGVDDSDTDDDGRTQKKRRKKYKPRVDKRSGEPKGKVKSAPYIEDSDVEVEQAETFE